MPQLPRTYLERPLARGTGAASGSPGLPATPRVDSSALQQAYGSLGRAGKEIGALGRDFQKQAVVMAELDQKLKAAQDVATRADKYGQWLLRLGAEEEATVNDPSAPPLLWDEILQGRMQDYQAELLDDVQDPTTRTYLQGQMHEHLAGRQRALRDKGKPLFVERATAGLTTVNAQLQRQYLATADPLMRAQIRQTQSELYSQFEAKGFVPPGATGAQMLTNADESSLAEAQALVVADPEAAEAHLTLLAKGQPGTPGLPVPAAHEVPRLLDAAQTEVDQQISRRESLRQIARVQLGDAQEKNATQVIQAVRQVHTLGGLEVLQRQANQLANDPSASGLGYQEFLRVNSEIDRHRAYLTEGRDRVSDPQVLDQFKLQWIMGARHRTRYDTYALLEDLHDAVMERKLSMRDAQPLIVAVEQELDLNNPIHDRIVQQERDGLAQSTGGALGNDVTLSMFDERVQDRVVSVALFDAEMIRLWETQGKEAYQKAAPAVRTELELTFAREKFKALSKDLDAEPTRVSPAILDEAAWQADNPPSREAIKTGFAEGTSRLAAGVRSGQYDRMQALGLLEQLKARKQYWDQLSRAHALRQQKVLGDEEARRGR